MKTFSYCALLIACLFAAQVLAATAKRDPAPLISIEVEPSRPKLVAGEGISIVGTIENISDKTVYIRESSLTMTLPVELEGSRSEVYGYAAYFPTEYHDENRSQPYEEYFGNVIALSPGDKYVAYWTSSVWNIKSRSSMAYIWYQISSQLQYLFFYPGDYKLLIAAKYWTDPKLPADDYRTVTRGSTVAVGAPLFVILVGAALGGLIAYVIFPKLKHTRVAWMKPWVDTVVRHGVGGAGAILLSVIVTIMLSRIAETQFIISVTVNDVWGAIVIGFVAQYGGTKALEKLVG